MGDVISSFCKADADLCVKVSGLDTQLIRVSSTVPGAGAVVFTRPEWEVFLKGAQAGEFGLRPERQRDPSEWIG